MSEQQGPASAPGRAGSPGDRGTVDGGRGRRDRRHQPPTSTVGRAVSRAEGTTTEMRGIVSIAGYVPYRRLQRSAVAQLFGSGGGKGTRSVASHDEDTTTMGVEAARLALRSVPRRAAPDALWFATADPGLPGQDQRHHHPRRPAPARPRCPPSTSAGRCGRGPGPCAPPWPRRHRHHPGGRCPTCATACPPRPTRRAGGDGAAAVLVGGRRPGQPRSSPSTWAGPRSPTSSSTAGGRRATAGPRCGRSASARPATCPWAPRPGSRP